MPRKRSSWTDFESLKLFADEAEALDKMRFFKEGFTFGVQIVSNAFGVDVREHGIDDENLLSFLTKLRLFLSEKEPVHLHRIYNISEKLITDERVITPIRKSRKEWKLARKAPSIRFIFNQRRIETDDVVDWWMNGMHFHHDKDKKQRIMNLPPFMRAITRYEFISAILTAAGHVVWVGMNVRYALNNNLVAPPSVTVDLGPGEGELFFTKETVRVRNGRNGSSNGEAARRSAVG